MKNDVWGEKSSNTHNVVPPKPKGPKSQLISESGKIRAWDKIPTANPNLIGGKHFWNVWIALVIVMGIVYLVRR